MKYSNAYIRKMNKAFSLFNTCTSEGALPENVAFSKFITIDIYKEEFEIPTLIVPIALNSLLIGKNNKQVPMVPLFVGENRTYPFKTSDSLIGNLMSVGIIPRLKKVATFSGDIYYGGKGVIMNKDFNPLMICCFKAHFNPNYTPFYDERALILTEKIIHISSEVFLNPTNIVNHSIVKKLIPYFLSEYSLNSVDLNTACHYAEVECNDKPATIIIDDFHNLVECSSKLHPSDTPLSDDLNKFLLENVENIALYDL